LSVFRIYANWDYASSRCDTSYGKRMRHEDWCHREVERLNGFGHKAKVLVKEYKGTKMCAIGEPIFGAVPSDDEGGYWVEGEDQHAQSEADRVCGSGVLG